MYAPTLLAFHQTPASTLFNQLLALGLWGACLLVGWRGGRPPGFGHRSVDVALGLLALAMAVSAWQRQSTQELAGWAFLAAAAAVLRLGMGAMDRTENPRGLVNDPLQSLAHGLAHGLALGCLLAGAMGLLIGCVQVFQPQWADGAWIARSAFIGRAVGNVRQPNHLATLLLMASVGAVWLCVRERQHWALGVVLVAAFVFGVVLSASRTGLWFGVPLLVLWGLLDRELPKPWRAVLLSTPLMAAVAWWGMHLWAQSGAGVFGAETRLDQEGAGSPSRIGILRNAWTLLQMHPWTGVGWGEFNRAWTLTPFPDRPIAFFDHTHNLPLQVLVELGWPLGLAVLGLLLAALVHAARQAWKAHGVAATDRRAALMLVLVVGVHSLLEYPLWYAYFLLPSAMALGIALAPTQQASGRPASWPRWVGGLLVVGSLFALWEYRKVVAIYAPSAQAQPLAARIEQGQRTFLFSRHADYAAATALGTHAEALAAAQRTGHQLIDARLLMAWAKSLHAVGETDKARYLVARLREFRSREGSEWLKVCDEDPAQWMCTESRGRYSWRDF